MAEALRNPLRGRGGGGCSGARCEARALPTPERDSSVNARDLRPCIRRAARSHCSVHRGPKCVVGLVAGSLRVRRTLRALPVDAGHVLTVVSCGELNFIWGRRPKKPTTSCGTGNSLFTGGGVGDILLAPLPGGPQFSLFCPALLHCPEYLSSTPASSVDFYAPRGRERRRDPLSDRGCAGSRIRSSKNNYSRQLSG